MVILAGSLNRRHGVSRRIKVSFNMWIKNSLLLTLSATTPEFKAKGSDILLLYISCVNVKVDVLYDISGEPSSFGIVSMFI